jgi:hypothetical protein
MRNFFPGRLAAGLTCLCLAAAAAAPAPNLWAAMAERDLKAIHDAIRDNHPGPVDTENPHYRDWLEGGLVQASREARAARTYSDYMRALRRYTNGFQDGHVSLDTAYVPARPAWAGFVAGGGSDDRPQVIYAEPDAGMKAGDLIESCDGRSIDALMRARTDPYYWNSAIPQARMNWIGLLFVANPDEQDKRLASCRFSSGEVKLHWRSIGNDELNRKTVDALSGADQEFALKRVDGVWFVRAPRFWLKSDDDQAKLTALVADLTAKAAEMRKATVVFDVRGNGGGNSLWGYRLAAALWGEALVDRVEGSFDSTHDVRVSPANIRKVSEIIDIEKRQNMVEALPYWTGMLNKMRTALAAGRPLIRMGGPPTPPTGPAPPNPVSGRIFLLTDPGCGSACLDFADLLLRLPGVTQIGRPTYADAVYIDVNQTTLPSGLVTLDYGMKVFRHRVRANNQWYDPKYRWPGGPMTDAAIAAWVKSLPQ